MELRCDEAGEVRLSTAVKEVTIPHFTDRPFQGSIPVLWSIWVLEESGRGLSASVNT